MKLSVGVSIKRWPTPTVSAVRDDRSISASRSYASRPKPNQRGAKSRSYWPKALDLSAHKLTETTSLKQRLEANPALDGSGVVLWKFSANLDVAINSSLSLSVGVIDTYNTEPPEGAVKNDVTVFTGINVKFGGP